MNKIIEQLRDVNNKIKDIEQRKAELKKKLEQKRSSITPAELEAIKTQKAELDAELRSQQAVKSTLSELAQDKEKEQNGGRDFLPGAERHCGRIQEVESPRYKGQRNYRPYQLREKGDYNGVQRRSNAYESRRNR